MCALLDITHSKGHREAFICPVIHLSCHSSVHPSGHPSISSWSVYSDEAEKEWNADTARLRILYISVVIYIYYFIFYFGVFGFKYTHPVSFSTTERVGLGFFSFFLFEILFGILEIFNAFYIAIIFYYSSMDARASSR